MEKFKLAVLISGSGTNLQALINKFDSDERIEICCVIRITKKPMGWKELELQELIIYRSSHNNFPSRKEFEEALIKSLSKYNPDLLYLPDL